MQMLASAAACGTGNTDWEAGENGLTFGGEDLREVAITDAEIAVAESYEVAGTGIVAGLFHSAVEHGIDNGGTGGEVNAIVHRALAGERVGAVAER